ncbi:unnamed protein product, partial [Porites lobata]
MSSDDSTTLEDLEESFDDLTVSGQSNEQLTSTPEKDRSLSARHVKHDLTPKSKCASLPASKRRQIGRSLNSREIRSRQDELYSRLKEGFEEREGASTDQSVMLEYLNLGEADKSFLTRGVKEVFPSSELRRTRRKGGQLSFYKYVNIAVRAKFGSLGLTSTFEDDSDEIISIKRQILASEETMKQIWIHLMEGLEENDLLTLAEARERDRYVSGLINLYEKEIKKL